MRIDIVAGGRTLHSHEMDDLLGQLGDFLDSAGTGGGLLEDLTIDLTDLSYATPSGITWLLAALHSLNRRRTENPSDIASPMIRVLPPSLDNPRVRIHYWLKWMRFYELLDEYGIRCDWRSPGDTLTAAARRELEDRTVLVLTELKKGRDVAEVVGTVTGGVAALLRRHLQFDTADIANLGQVLAEACHNIIDHAGANACGLVAAQVIRRPKQEPYVMIGVADNGIGIRASLSHAFPDAADWSDARAIEEALKQGVSGVPDEDRGLGLSSIVEKIPKYRGTLHLRSGSARLRVKADGEGVVRKEFPSSPSVPGTMLCLTLRKP